jgi:hypothetical protein
MRIDADSKGILNSTIQLLMLALIKFKTVKVGWSMVDRTITDLENLHINLNPKLKKMLQISKGNRPNIQDYYNIVFLQVNFTKT